MPDKQNEEAVDVHVCEQLTISPSNLQAVLTVLRTKQKRAMQLSLTSWGGECDYWVGMREACMFAIREIESHCELEESNA